jgi:hypothetical protein
MQTQRFVDIWQGSASLGEVVERTGKTRRYCSQKAAYLRKQGGLDLKKFARGTRLDSVVLSPPDVARNLLRVEDLDAEEEAAQKNDEKPPFNDDDGADW